MPSNPILPGFNPDPSICRVGEDFFLAVSSFEYFPGVPLYHSKDLINWTLIGHALNRRSQLDMRAVDPGAGVWAPTLRHWKGRFYLATCTVFWRAKKPIQPRGFYVSTDNIFDDASWSDPVYFDMLGIDQDLFFDDDDRVYLCVSRFSTGPRQAEGSKLVTYACEIDITTGNSLSPTEPIRTSTVKGGVAEGPHIYKWGGWYYLVTADGGTGPRHQVWITRSQNPLGPYEEAPDGVNPLVYNGLDRDIQRTGHADLVQTADGQWWMVMLGVRPQDTQLAQLGRETFLAPVAWVEGGWPTVNNGKLIGSAIEGNLPDKAATVAWRDDFTNGSLELGWYHLRTPIKPCHTFTSRENGLKLVSNGFKIDQFESPAMLLRKQTAYRGIWSTRLDFAPTNDFEEAGTVVFYSDVSYAAIVVKRIKGSRVILARWTDHVTRTIKEIVQALPGLGSIDLHIRAEPTQYTLSYHPVGNDKATELVSLSSMVLDGGSPVEYEFYFTGAHFGLFNQTVDGENCLCPATFRWASFEDGDIGAEVKTSALQEICQKGRVHGHESDGTLKGPHGHVNGSSSILVK